MREYPERFIGKAIQVIHGWNILYTVHYKKSIVWLSSHGDHFEMAVFQLKC